MNVALTQPPPAASSASGYRRYDNLLAVLESRATARAFDPGQSVSPESPRLILEAARLAPSGANTQPWQFIVVSSARVRHAIAAALVDAQAQRAAAAPSGQGAGIAQIDYRGAASAPGCIVVVTDFRLTWAYPGLMDGTEMDQRYHATAERIILQSVAAATTAAHLAAAALGYESWWISVLGQDDVQSRLHDLLGVPDDLTITDILLYGVAAQPVPKRWKKPVDDIISWNRFDLAHFRSLEQIDAWMRDVRERFARKQGLLF